MTPRDLDLSGMTHQERRQIARVIYETDADWVVLVGSWARGTQVAHISDIDVLVGAPTKGRRRPMQRMHVFYLDETKLQGLATAGNDVVLWFLKFGVPLSGAARWRDVRERVLRTRPRVNFEKKFDLARKQLTYADSLLRMGDLEAAHEELHVAAEHLGRGLLFKADVFPGSRREIPNQLREIACADLAQLLDDLRSNEVNGLSLAKGVKLSGDLIDHHQESTYARRLRSDPEFVRQSEAAERLLLAGPPWDDQFSPRELVEEINRQES
jgi:predicted nucleotidyltransferase